MKETGILFTPPNHRLILSGKKVQTRRVINPQPQEPGVLTTGDGNWRVLLKNGMTKVFGWEHDCPYGGVGDKLYVREGIIIHADGNTLAGYYMDGARVTNLGEKRLTAMFMAKRYARTWLELIDVRAERLQDISAEDALAEGISKTDFWKPKEVEGKPFEEKWWDDNEFWKRYPQIAYSKLWDSINKKKHPWEQNPFVWVLEFRKI